MAWPVRFVYGNTRLSRKERKPRVCGGGGGGGGHGSAEHCSIGFREYLAARSVGIILVGRVTTEINYVRDEIPRARGVTIEDGTHTSSPPPPALEGNRPCQREYSERSARLLISDLPTSSRRSKIQLAGSALAARHDTEPTNGDEFDVVASDRHGALKQPGQLSKFPFNCHEYFSFSPVDDVGQEVGLDPPDENFAL